MSILRKWEPKKLECGVRPCHFRYVIHGAFSSRYSFHRGLGEAVAREDGRLRRLGRVDMGRDLLKAFAAKLSSDDIVVIEATSNAASAAAVIAPYVKKMVIANPKQVRAIAYAKIKTDTIDAGVLAHLYASGFLPEVWIYDPTQALRRQVTRRNQLVRQRSRLKNIIQSILHAHRIPSIGRVDHRHNDSTCAVV